MVIIKQKRKKLSPNCTACLVLTTRSVDKVISPARRDTKADFLNASPSSEQIGDYERIKPVVLQVIGQGNRFKINASHVI